MSYEKTVTVAGATIFVTVASRKPKGTPGAKRKQRQQPTPEQVQKINQKNSERVLSIILNHNFGPGDYHIVLTYSGEPPKKDEARRRLDRFKRSISSLYKKHGKIAKWVAATEYENARIHHHMVVSAGVDLEEIDAIWPHGFVRPTWLDDTGDYRKLAEYLIKETSKTFRDPGAVSRRRFGCSRSIVRPEPKVDSHVAASHLLDPKPVEGYYIDSDSIYKGENPFTGRPYIEYVMVAVDKPRIQQWNRGRRKQLRHRYLQVPRYEQLDIDMGECDG